MHEAVACIRNYCFNEMNIDVLNAVVLSANTRSKKLLENHGFRESVQRPGHLKNDEIFYSLQRG
jgi:RimJ/RimL family protein N-acetyltransferase